VNDVITLFAIGVIIGLIVAVPVGIVLIGLWVIDVARAKRTAYGLLAIDCPSDEDIRKLLKRLNGANHDSEATALVGRLQSLLLLHAKDTTSQNLKSID